MQISRTKYAVVNTVSFFLKELIALVCNFILPRLIIGHYGSDYNGLVASITQFLNVISFLRIGIAGAARFSFYKPLSKKDGNELSATANAFQRYMQKTGLIVLLYIVALSIVYPLLFGKGFNFLDTFLLVIALGASVFAQYFFGLIYSTILDADQKAFIVNIVNTLCNVTVTAIACVLIVGNFSLLFVKIVTSLLWVIPPVFIYFFVKKKYKINPKTKPDKSKIKRKNDVMFHSLANIVHENVDVLSLTLFSTKAIISVYSVYALVLSGLRQIVSIFTGSLEAPFGNMFARNEQSKIIRNLNAFEFITFGIASIIYGVAFILILPFVHNYVGTVSDVQYALPLYAFVCVLATLCHSLRTPYQTVVQAGGFYKETKIYAALEAILNIAISFALVPFFGIVGVAIGTAIANLFRTISYAVFVYKRIFHVSISPFLKGFIFLLLNVLSIYCFTFKFSQAFAYSSWLNWIMCGFAFTGTSVLVVLFNSIVFYKDSLLYVINRFSIRRKKHA